MVRTQIQLTEAQAAALRRMAAERGVSMAALIRDAVEQVIEAQETQRGSWARALAVVGKYSSGLTDVAEEHDRYLEEAYRD